MAHHPEPPTHLGFPFGGPGNPQPTTLTAGELIAKLRKFDPAKPVIVGTDEWFLNLADVELEPEEATAITLVTTDDFDTRQW